MAALRVLACVLLFWLVWLAPALAQSTRSVFLEELTWTELRDLMHAGATTIIVPIGGTEENGPDMALGKHNVRAKVLSERIARALGQTIVAPVIAYVPEGDITPPTEHMRFPGTISIPRAAFMQMLDGAARSFRQHGFRDIVFLGDHGGYQADEQAVADRLDKEWAATPVRVHAITEYYAAAQRDFARLLADRGYPAAEIGTHAGLADTALMLATDPGLVRAERLHSGAKPGTDGILGDPRRATAQLGQAGVDLIVAETVRAIRAAVAHR